MLRVAAAAVVSAAPIAARAAEETAANAAEPGNPAPWWLGPEHPRSRVVEVRSARAVNGVVADPGMVRRMLRQGIMELTDLRTPEAAVREIIGDRRRVAIKFNSVGAGAIGTTDVLARELVEVLVDGGVAQDEITLVEGPATVAHDLGLRAPVRGWVPGIRVGAAIESVAAWVTEADAIINVPFLKTHQFAGMSGALKNVSHAIVRRPARYHGDGCTPFVAQIFGNPLVTRRVRLNLMNALRIVTRGGPDANSDDIVTYGAILSAFDAVAVDAIGRTILERERAALPDGGALPVKYLEDAAARGIGRATQPLVVHTSVDVNP